MTAESAIRIESRELADETRTVELGQQIMQTVLALKLKKFVLFLEGNLGTGKTTLSRGVLRGIGYEGAVKSPTYTIVEPYEMDSANVYHFDLYRLGDPEELELMGIRDYLAAGSETQPTVCIFEWPERGAGVLTRPDMSVTLNVVPSLDKEGETSRIAELKSLSPTGLNALKNFIKA